MILTLYFLFNMLASGFLLFGFCVNAIKERFRMDRYDVMSGAALLTYHAVSWYHLIN